MPITTLDATTALLVIDLQAGTTANPSAHPIDGIIDRAISLVDAFRVHSLPVVLATVTGTPTGRTGYGPGGREFPTEWSALVPRLSPQPDDIILRRTTWSAFAGTDLTTRLVDLGVTQVVVVGLATSFGVESTARAAHDLGLNVALPTDAMTDPRLESHDGSVARVFPALGETGTTAEVLALLEAR
ncbi:hydrolase [Leifsonia sp. Leaf325]|nr:cysteine hydrolase [Leifsonia sp. Leaf325]KQQ93184.1 hydrolase [Leifsonia sp. Leaf325]